MAATYVLVWVLLTFFPVISAWKRQWMPFVLYTAGWFIFLYTVLQKKGGWDDLADIATFIIVIIPVYLIASLVWLFTSGRQRRGRR